MNKIIIPRFTTLILCLLTLVLVIAGWINFDQRSRFQAPDDGVSWIDTPSGVEAWIVMAEGPGARAGIREGDILQAVNGNPVRRATQATRQIFQSGIWSQATYDLARNGQAFEASVIIEPQLRSAASQDFRTLVGLLYLVIGIFVLFRRWRAPKSFHFYLFCLASFVLYSFSYTGKLNGFDWSVYWLNVVAWILVPALFLHFCLTFPERSSLLEGRRWLAPVIYLPGLLLLAWHSGVATGTVILPVSLLTARWILDRSELIYLAIYFLAGAAFLQRSYRQAQAPVLKQQLKWLTRGAYLSIIPFAALYALPYFLGFIPAPWMKISVVSLVFLPITFGYAIVRYRLMDVDIIFRRGIAYTLATLAIVGLYFALIAIFADLFHNLVPVTGHLGWILAIIVTALLFQPMVNWIQARLDRFFNPDRYDYRSTLLEFARELGSELRLERLLDQVTVRLSEILHVDRVGVFIRSGTNQISLVKSQGIEISGRLDMSFLDPENQELAKGTLFFESVRRAFGLTPSAQKAVEQLGLHYYLPFRVKDRTLGYLGLGKTRRNDFLSSEDIDLLQTITGYASIALENARLYESLEQKALQNQALWEFSESMIESIDAGVLACDLAGRIESWNSTLERMYGLERKHVLGKRLREIFDLALVEELPPAGESRQGFSLYKRRLRAADGRELIVNLSVTPLVGKDGEIRGRLVVLNDLTERVSLEDQLVQSEKLSSIGLLAAGVAHEVNTPLAVIASQGQMLLRQTPDGSPQRPVLEKIVKQSFRASDIVNNLLKFSRLSGSERAELDLNKVIQETASLLDPMIRASKIRLNLQLASELPAVYGNFGKLQQVFMNLVLNARDAMPMGGELMLVTEHDQSVVRAEVCDTGVGIAPEVLSRIFDPFFTTKGTGRGTGLGLAVTYGIISEHSGKIQVKSKQGKGTTFRLEFPLVRKSVHVA
ncbi:MAG TPA: ATP-binding protein [Terriglobia bacterium]|nr:ATP-binding protein [Terriglobia bacterium]